MRISDWSSDVCSSDLVVDIAAGAALARHFGNGVHGRLLAMDADLLDERLQGTHGGDVELPAAAAPVAVADPALPQLGEDAERSEEHTSELQSLMRSSYAVFCLKKKNNHTNHTNSRQY